MRKKKGSKNRNNLLMAGAILFALVVLALISFVLYPYYSDSQAVILNMENGVTGSVSIYCAEISTIVSYNTSGEVVPQYCSVSAVKTSSYKGTPIVFFNNVSCFGQDYTNKVDGLFDNGTIYINNALERVSSRMILLHEYCHYNQKDAAFHYMEGDCSNPFILQGIQDEETSCYKAELNFNDFIQAYFLT